MRWHTIKATAVAVFLLHDGANAQAVPPGEAMDAPTLAWTAAGSGPAWSSVTGAAAYDGADALICRMDAGEGSPAGVELPGYLAGGILETTVSGPAVVSFRWRSDDSRYGRLVFFIDGVTMGDNATTTDALWNRAVADLPSGPHTLRWQVNRPGQLPSGSIATVTLDQLIVEQGAVWDVASALNDPEGIWATLGAAEVVAESGAAAPAGGTGVSLIGEGPVFYSTLTRLVEGPAIADWQWNGRPATDGDVYSWVREYPWHPDTGGWEFTRSPQRDVWQGARSAVPNGRTTLSFWYEIDDGDSSVPIPVLYLDHFQISPAAPSDMLGLTGVAWTQSGARPWRISAASLGAREPAAPGSLHITDAVAGESSFLKAQISGPVVLTWLGRTTAPAGDRITALVDGHEAGSSLIPPVYPESAIYGVEIPQGEHEVTIALIAGAAPVPAGQPRGGAVGSFKLINPPPNVEAWTAALGLPAGTQVYADPRWSLTAEGASLPATAMCAPLVIPVSGPAVVRVPMETVFGSQPHWIGVTAEQRLLALPPHSPWIGSYPTHFKIGSLTTSRALLTGADAAAEALEAAPGTVQTSAVMAVDFPGIDAVGDDALFLNNYGAVGIAVEGPGNVQYRIANHDSSQGFWLTRDGEYQNTPTVPDGSQWREGTMPVAAGTHLVSFHGFSLVMDHLRFTPATRVTIPEALDTPGRAWRTDGALVFGVTGTSAAVGGDYTMLETGWAGGARLETDLSGPVKVTFLCQAKTVNSSMSMAVDDQLVLTLPVPHTTWHPVEVYLPGPSTTFSVHFHGGGGVVCMDRFAVTPAEVNTLAGALEWNGGPLHAAASGAAWSIVSDGEVAGGDALRVEFTHAQASAEFRADVAGPAVIRWRQKCDCAPGSRSVSVSANAELEPVLLTPDDSSAWTQHAVTIPAGTTWVRWEVNRPNAVPGGGPPAVFLDDFQVLPVGSGLGDALHHPELPWRTSPEWPWVPAAAGAISGPARTPGATASWIETTVTGPAAATFILTTTDSGEFVVDGVEKFNVTNSGTWLHTEPLSAGEHILRWRFEPPHRAGPMTLKRFDLTAASAAPSLTAILGAPGQTWTTGGDGAWQPVILDEPGTVRAAASPLLAPGQSSWLETTVTGPARIEWVPGNSPLLHAYSDVFALEVNGVPCGPAQNSGRRAHVGPGEHRVRWHFSRGHASGLLPQVWLRSVTVIPAAPLNAPMAIGAPEGVWLDTAGQAFAVSLTDGRLARRPSSPARPRRERWPSRAPAGCRGSGKQVPRRLSMFTATQRITAPSIR